MKDVEPLPPITDRATLRRWRDELELRNYRLAALAGVHESTLSKIILGMRQPPDAATFYANVERKIRQLVAHQVLLVGLAPGELPHPSQDGHEPVD